MRRPKKRPLRCNLLPAAVGGVGSAQTMNEPMMDPDCAAVPASSSATRPLPTALGEITPSAWLPSGYCRNDGTSLESDAQHARRG